MKRKYKAKEWGKFGKDFRAWAAKFAPEQLERALRDTTAMVAAEAKRRAPVGIHRRGHRAGELRQSIAYEVKRQGSTVRGAVGSDVKQAKFTEFGTRYIEVGTPQAPRTTWPAKALSGTESNETMPWLRAAIWAMRAAILRRLRKIGKGR